MKGKNRISLCHGAMHEAVEYYLNQVVLKQPIKVISVETQNVNSVPTFVIGIEGVNDSASEQVAQPPAELT